MSCRERKHCGVRAHTGGYLGGHVPWTPGWVWEWRPTWGQGEPIL